MPTTDPFPATLELTRALIELSSVTPDDGGCQLLMMERLQAAGFHLEPMRFGEVDNFWATRGTSAPLLVFAGHTDVVPPGANDAWSSPPFSATETDGFLVGRGAADMKSSLAAMIVASERFVANHPEHLGTIGFLITSDEEGPARDGTRRVVETLVARGEHIDWCVVGEPSSTKSLGDLVKNGRRGSLNASLVIKGRQGHVAYPHLADNPIHRAMSALDALTLEQWDEGNAFFQPTCLQISNISAGDGTTNVIPGQLRALFNIRFSTEVTPEQLQARCEAILKAHDLDFTIDWSISGEPFLTPPGQLLDAVCDSILAETGLTAEVSTGGGTSDGRFIAPTGAQVVELGHVNETIHQVDERVAIEDIERLTNIYEGILERLLLPA